MMLFVLIINYFALVIHVNFEAYSMHIYYIKNQHFLNVQSNHGDIVREPFLETNITHYL